MPQLINKKKIYFYLLILLLLSSTYNFNIISKFENINSIRQIDILGLSEKEKYLVKENLEIFKNKNIFLIKKHEVNKRINIISFFDNYKIIKIFPSKLLIKVKKTKFVAKTIINGKNFYIGQNGKLTKMILVEKENYLPQVFGNFKVNDFLKLQEILNANRVELRNIKKYYYYKSQRWDIENTDDTILMLPSKNLEKSLKNYTSLIKSNQVTPGQTIDLRIQNKIILKNEKK